MTKPIYHSKIIVDDGGIDKTIVKLLTLKKHLEETAKIKLTNLSKLNPSSKSDQGQIAQEAKEIEELRKKYNGTDEQLKKLLQTQKKYKESSSEAAREIEKINEALSREKKERSDSYQKQKQAAKEKADAIKSALEKERKELDKLKLIYGGTDEQLKKLQTSATSLSQSTDKVTTATMRNREETKKAQREQRTKIQADIAEKGSIEALEKETNKLILERKKLQIFDAKTGALTSQNAQKYRQLTRDIKANTDQLKRFDQAIGRSQRFVGQYARAMTGLWNQVKLLAASYIGFYGAIRLGRNLISTFSGFESKMAGVRAITEATDEEFKALESDARRLGGATIFTSQQVADLQTEFGKLGFSTQEIIDATEATLGLAAATDEGLAESAAVAGATLRAFNLDATETQRIVDVMAKSFTSSALNLEKFREAMKLVAPVAASAGWSIEGTTAVLGKLADAGLYGSLAGTALRNIILRLSDSSSTLSKRLDTTVTSFEEFIPAMQKLADEGINIAEALELTDRRAVTAFNVLLGNTKGVETLALRLHDAAGAAQEMADIRMDTLAGDAKIAVSALQEFAIVIGDQVSGQLREFVQNFTDFIIKLKENWEAIKQFIKLVVLITTSLIAFRVGTLASKLAVAVFGREMRLAVKVFGLYAYAANRAKLATIGFTNALRTNVFGFLATALVTILSYVWLYNRRTEEAAEVSNEFNDVLNRQMGLFNAKYKALLSVNKGTELHKRLITEINKEYGDYMTNLLDEKSTLEDIAKAYSEVETQMRAKLAAQRFEEESSKIFAEQSKRELDKFREYARIARIDVLDLEAAWNDFLNGDFTVPSIFPQGQDNSVGIEYVTKMFTELKIAREEDEKSLQLLSLRYQKFIDQLLKTEKGKEAVQEMIWTLEKLRDERKRLIEEANDLQAKFNQDGTVIEENRKAYEKAGKEIAEYTKKIEALEALLGLNKSGRATTTKDKRAEQEYELQKMIIGIKYEGYQEEIKLAGLAYEYKRQKASEEIQDVTVRIATIKAMEEEFQQEIYQINLKWREKRLDEELEAIETEQSILDQRLEQEENAFDRRQQYAENEFYTKRRFAHEITKFEKKQAEDLEQFQKEQEIKKLEAQIDSTIKQMELRKKYTEYVLQTDATLTESNRKRLEADLINTELLTKLQIESIEELIEKIKAEIDAIGNDGAINDIYDLIGLDLDSTQKQGIKTATDFVIDQINRIADAKVEAAGRAVDAANKEVEAAENRLNRETTLRAAGLANSYDSAQKQLAQAKQAQEQALAQERRAALEQQRIAAIEQGSNLVSASAKIIAAFATQPWVYVPLLAAMWGTFAYAQLKVQELTAKQYKHGGYEELKGGSHASGKDVDLGRMPDGRPRRGEGGEGMAVFSRKAVSRYKNRIPRIVRAINSGELDTHLQNIGTQVFMSNSVDQRASQILIPESKDVGAIRRTVDKMGKRKPIIQTAKGQMRQSGITTKYRR